MNKEMGSVKGMDTQEGTLGRDIINGEYYLLLSNGIWLWCHWDKANADPDFEKAIHAHIGKWLRLHGRLNCWKTAPVSFAIESVTILHERSDYLAPQ